MNARVPLLIAILFLLAGCSLAEDVTPPPSLATQQAAQIPAPPTSDRPPPAALEAVPPARLPDPQAGATIYLDRCAPCHGPAGLGQGSLSSNLEVPPTLLGDTETASLASPEAWYQVVTQGRMERFMPPFSSLSDDQRWDVVGYALTLSSSPEQVAEGGRLYLDACSKCHGPDGKGVGAAADLTLPEFYSGQTIASMLTTIQSGAQGMPGFGDVYTEQEQIALANYVRSLAAVPASVSGVVPTVEATIDPASEVPPNALFGSIEGQVTNATSGGSLPSGLEVAIVGFDGDTPVFNQSVPVDSAGRYSIDGLEIVAGRIYGAIVEYEGIPYYSTAGHILADAPNLDLPLTIFETTPDMEGVQVERLHVIFDFSVESVVEVSQLWLVTNTGDKTVAQPSGQNAIPIALPVGTSNLQFSDPAAQALYTPTGDGFLMLEPIRPDSPAELIFSFSLPYKDKLDFEQLMPLPVNAVVVLSEQNAPDIEGDQLVATGEQTMGALALRTYARAGLGAGETLTLSISGRSPTGVAGSPDTNLIIGIGALALALIVIGLGWRQLRSKDIVQPDPEMKATGTIMDRDQLLYALAGLDTAYERGEIEEEAYRTQRARLKAELASLISTQDD